MKNITGKLAPFFLFLVLAQTVLFAEPPPPPPPFGPEPFGIFGPGGKNFERIAQDLGLTQEQLEKAKTAREKRFTSSKPLREKLSPLHEDLRKLLEASKVDMGLVRSKLKEIADIQLELRIYHIQDRLEFESFLTPEQKSKLTKMHKERIQRMSERREPPFDHHKDRERDCKCL